MGSPTQGMWVCQHQIDGRDYCEECFTGGLTGANGSSIVGRMETTETPTKPASIIWANEDGEFRLSDNSFGNPGCECGMADAVVKVDGRYLCRAEAERLKLTRLAYTPTVVAALREAARLATDLADHLENCPGVGIGLSYAGPTIAFDTAEATMRHYQNDLR